MTELKKWRWHAYDLFVLIGGTWVVTLPRWHRPISRPLDVVAMAAIFSSMVYLPRLLGSRQKIGIILLLVLFYPPLFYYCGSKIAFSYVIFIFLLQLEIAASMQIQSKQSFMEANRDLWHLLRHEPSEAEARLLAKIRMSRNRNTQAPI